MNNDSGFQSSQSSDSSQSSATSLDFTSTLGDTILLQDPASNSEFLLECIPISGNPDSTPREVVTPIPAQPEQQDTSTTIIDLDTSQIISSNPTPQGTDQTAQTPTKAPPPNNRGEQIEEYTTRSTSTPILQHLLTSPPQSDQRRFILTSTSGPTTPEPTALHSTPRTPLKENLQITGQIPCLTTSNFTRPPLGSPPTRRLPPPPPRTSPSQSTQHRSRTVEVQPINLQTRTSRSSTTRTSSPHSKRRRMNSAGTSDTHRSPVNEAAPPARELNYTPQPQTRYLVSSTGRHNSPRRSNAGPVIMVPYDQWDNINIGRNCNILIIGSSNINYLNNTMFSPPDRTSILNVEGLSLNNLDELITVLPNPTTLQHLVINLGYSVPNTSSRIKNLKRALNKFANRNQHRIQINFVFPDIYDRSRGLSLIQARNIELLKECSDTWTLMRTPNKAYKGDEDTELHGPGSDILIATLNTVLQMLPVASDFLPDLATTESQASTTRSPRTGSTPLHPTTV